MKHALIAGQLIPASQDAPPMATCPNCGGVVELRKRTGTYFWRHTELPKKGCSPEKDPPRWRRELEE